MANKTTLSDEEIALGIIKGDKYIENMIYSEFKRLGFGYLVKRGAKEAVADEITHDALVILFQKMPQLYENIRNGEQGKLSSYYISICKNKHSSVYKKSKKTILIEDDHYFQSLTAQDFEAEKDDEYFRTLREEVLLLLAREKETKLKEDCRDFLNYQYWDRMSLAEIAQIFNYTEKYAKKKAKNSRDYLRKIILKAIQNRPELRPLSEWIN
ncbi:MAG: sigma-70 family RNA polymerase sigma factor, partial [Bacteroidetes bacterium]